MDESQLPLPSNGEATPSDIGTEEVAVTEAETSEVATSEQPAEETTGEQPKASRAQARISELASERNYWKDLALQNAPLNETPKPDSSEEGVGLEDIANAVVGKLEEKARLSKAEQAQKVMYQDALQATAEFPELDSDERLAKRVIAIAQADGISITEAARDYLGTTKAQTRKVAESTARETVATPSAKGVSNGQPAPLDLNSLSEEQKEANWGSIVARMTGRE